MWSKNDNYENQLKEENLDTEGNLNTKVNEAYFKWRENIIVGLTEEGSKQSSIVIPSRCEGFSGVIFQDTNVKYVTFEDDDDIELDVAFMGAEQLISITLPKNLTKIPSMSFEGCISLKSISIPASVTVLGSYSFKFCSSLEKVTFEGNNIKVIEEYAFQNCSSLKNIEIPNGVTTIGKYAFEKCKSLENISLSSTVNKIEKFAFSHVAAREITFPQDIHIEIMDTSAFGVDTFQMTVYIYKGSWSDQNRSVWDIGFYDVKYK